jgi:hypothetical protein
MTPPKPKRTSKPGLNHAPEADAGTEWLTMAPAICDGREVAVSGDDAHALAALALLALVTNHFRDVPEGPAESPQWADELVSSLPRIPRPLARALIETFEDQVALAEREDTPANLSLPLLGWRQGSQPGRHSWMPPSDTDTVMTILVARNALSENDAVLAAGHAWAGVVATAENTPDAALEAIARRSNPELSKLLCERPELPAAAIEILATDKSPDTRYLLALHHAWDASAAVLATLARDRAPRVVAAVAEACPEDFARITNDKKPPRLTLKDRVRERASRPYRNRFRAADAETDSAELLKLVQDPDAITRARVLRRNDVADELRASISTDASSIEAVAVAKASDPMAAIEYLHSVLAHDQESKADARQWAISLIQRVIIDRTDLDDTALNALADMDDVTALRLAGREALPQSVIAKLANHASAHVREAIAERPDISRVTARTLAEDPDDSVALTALLTHPLAATLRTAKARVAEIGLPLRLAAALLLPADGILTKPLLMVLAGDQEPSVRGSVGIRPDLDIALGTTYSKVAKALTSDTDSRIRDLMQHWTESLPDTTVAPAAAAPGESPTLRKPKHLDRSSEISDLPIELVDIVDLSLHALHEKLRILAKFREWSKPNDSRSNDRLLSLILKHAPEFTPEAQNRIAETSSWIYVWRQFDDLADDRSTVRRERLRAQRQLVPVFPRLVMTARRTLIRELLPESADLLLSEYYDELNATERKCFQNHANPRVTAALLDFEAAMSAGDTRPSTPSSLSIARVDSMSHRETIEYVSNRTHWPTHVEHIIRTQILDPTNTRSNYALVDLFDGMSELAIAIASNPEALRNLSEEGILELLSWHTGHVASRGWDTFQSARQGDRWAFEEALAKNLSVLSPRIVRTLETSSSRKVKAMLREAAKEVAPSVDVESLKRSALSDDELADLLASTDVGVIRAVIGNDELLLAATPAQQAALAKRADPKSARAMAAKAGTLSETAQIALANSGLFVVRRTLADLDPETLCTEAKSILRDDIDDVVRKKVASWTSQSGKHDRGTAPRAHPRAQAKKPASTIASMDQNALLALIADDQKLQALSPDDQVIIATHRSVDVPRALAKKSPLLSPQAHVALAQSPIFTARRELVRTAGTLIDPSLLDELANDDDEVVQRIAQSIRDNR